MSAVVRTETTVREWDAAGRLLSEKVTTVEDRTPTSTTEVTSESTTPDRRPAGFIAGHRP